MIGISLSFCIKDIIEGQVNKEDVEMIYSGTHARNPKQWDRVIKHYREFYWRTNPDLGAQIAREFLADNKIRQLREEGKIPMIYDGHWVEDLKCIPIIEYRL